MYKSSYMSPYPKIKKKKMIRKLSQSIQKKVVRIRKRNKLTSYNTNSKLTISKVDLL